MSDLLVRGAHLPGLDAADIVVRAGRIVAIGGTGTPGENLSDLPAIDALGCLVLPGLVDAHCHIAHLILRQQATDLDTGRLPGVHVETDRLTAQERSRLHEALRAIDRLRKRTQIDLLGQQI